MSCINCYRLTVGGQTDTYTLQKRLDGNIWFKDNVRVADSGVISTLFSLTDSDVKRANSEVLCSPRQEVVTLQPYGVSYVNETGVISPPATAKSITIMVEPTSTSGVAISFDGGTNWLLAVSKREVKTWGDENSFIDLSMMRIKPSGASATFDIHGEM
jgi:hypothetical protein